MGLNSEAGYSHRFHAGNVGDVWKHCVLLSALTALRDTSRALLVIETHAGHGRYELASTGEWSEGIGKLWARAPDSPPAALRRYLELVPPPSTHRARRYPGSPELIMALKRESDRAVFCDIDPTATTSLRAAVQSQNAEVRETDGLAALPELLAQAPASLDVLVHIDPPYGLKADWLTVPDALIEAYRARPSTHFLMWYPVKSYTRPNAMLQRLEKANLPSTTLELITTPLEFQRNRLNGSGMLTVGIPERVHSEVLAATPALGRACATHGARWTTRAVSFASDWRASTTIGAAAAPR